MEDEVGIHGRDKEIKEIYKFIASKIESRKSGILYLTGPPGTGKTMSMQFVLDRIKTIPKVSLNCMRTHSSKTVLSKIGQAFGMDKISQFSESEIISRMSKKLTSRTCETHLIVLDEMDQLPKSKNIRLIKTIFSWTQETHSKLIIVGIANTLNLTSRYEAISTIIGRQYDHIKKILFRPYTSMDIRNILKWYLENDENFEDACVDQTAIDMISKKYARENGDIRGALNALRGSIDDTTKQPTKSPETSILLTPPSTPPQTPCKEKQVQTNIASVANSIKKRHKDTHYSDDICPFPHQIILTCIVNLSSKNQNNEVDSRDCFALASSALNHSSLPSSRSDYLAMLDYLEAQGLVSYKKGRIGKHKILLRVSESELDKLLQRKDIIMNLLNTLI